MNDKTQIIKRKCCGTIFAACIEPDCYIDKGWLKDLKNYVNAGHKVEMIDANSGVQFAKCTCQKVKIQLNIFDGLTAPPSVTGDEG